MPPDELFPCRRNARAVIWGGSKVDNLPFEPYSTSPIVADPEHHVIIWMRLQSTADIGQVAINVTLDWEHAV